MKDGYTDYRKRSMRYKTLPRDSIFATAPATMFVAFLGETPVGVIGYGKYKNLLLDAGVHVRKEYRGRGLTGILLDKMIKEKGNKTYLVNVSNELIVPSYRNRGFVDIDRTNLPEEILEELDMAGDLEQVQKYMQHLPEKWMGILKFSAAMRPSQMNKPEEVEVELDKDALAESCCEQAKLDAYQAWIKSYEDVKLKIKGKMMGDKPDEWWLEEIYNHTIEQTCYGLKDVIRQILKKDMQKVLDEWEECESGN